MKLWQNDRLDAFFEASIEQIVAQFRVSDWWTADLDLDSAVRGFLTDIDRSMLSGTTRPTWLRSAPRLGRSAGPGRHVRGRRPSGDAPFWRSSRTPYPAPLNPAWQV